MKPIAPQIATQAPTPSAVRQTICSRKSRDVVPERLGDLLAEREPVERRAEPEQQSDDEQRRQRGEGGLIEAAVDERAHQPVIGLVKSERGGGERQRQRGQRAGQRADREARQQQGRGLARGPAEREQQAEREQAPATAPIDEASGAEKPSR